MYEWMLKGIIGDFRQAVTGIYWGKASVLRYHLILEVVIDSIPELVHIVNTLHSIPGQRIQTETYIVADALQEIVCPLIHDVPVPDGSVELYKQTISKIKREVQKRLSDADYEKVESSSTDTDKVKAVEVYNRIYSQHIAPLLQTVGAVPTIDEIPISGILEQGWSDFLAAILLGGKDRYKKVIDALAPKLELIFRNILSHKVLEIYGRDKTTIQEKLGLPTARLDKLEAKDIYQGWGNWDKNFPDEPLVPIVCDWYQYVVPVRNVCAHEELHRMTEKELKEGVEKIFEILSRFFELWSRNREEYGYARPQFSKSQKAIK